MRRLAVLFDLDGTLVNTESVRALRDAGNWKAAIRELGDTTTFPGIQSLLANLVDADIKVAVVTSSVSYYASSVLDHHGLPYTALIAYHDTRQHKPNPAPFYLALEKVGVVPSAALGVGDGSEDAEALSSAGIHSCGAGWSTTIDTSATWDTYLRTADELVCVITERTR
jgi:beta-phosphoglucomutase-like phosphatase (HAD superfamily)